MLNKYILLQTLSIHVRYIQSCYLSLTGSFAMGFSRLFCVLLCVCFYFGWSFCYKIKAKEDDSGPDQFKPRYRRSSVPSMPSITTPPKSGHINELDTLFLYCGATGNPPPTITWSKVNGSLPVNRIFIQVNIGLLMIRNVQKSDEGRYKCTAVNHLGGSAAFATITVKAKKVTSPAKILQGPKSLYLAEEGHNVTLTCQASGNPRPVITWLKISPSSPNSTTIDTGTPTTSTDQDTTTSNLTVSFLSQKDNGFYSCKAINQQGSQSSPLAQLTVIRSFRFTQKPPRTVPAIEGQRIYLHCQAFDSDMVSWELPLAMANAQGSTIQHSNGTLEITEVKAHAHGVFTCKAIQHNGGLVRSMTASVHLTVKENNRGLEHSKILTNYHAKYLQVLTGYLEPVLKNSRSSRWVKCWHYASHDWKTFHSMCNNKGPTVTIARYREYVFGGYTDTTWKSIQDYAGESTFKSFLYSIYNTRGFHPVYLPLRGYNNYEAIYDSKIYGPVFGSGFDLKLHRNAWNKESYTRPNTYMAPPGCDYTNKCTFFTGRKDFIPHDVEVFYEVTN